MISYNIFAFLKHIVMHWMESSCCTARILCTLSYCTRAQNSIDIATFFHQRALQPRLHFFSITILFNKLHSKIDWSECRSQILSNIARLLAEKDVIQLNENVLSERRCFFVREKSCRDTNMYLFPLNYAFNIVPVLILSSFIMYFFLNFHKHRVMTLLVGD